MSAFPFERPSETSAPPTQVMVPMPTRGGMDAVVIGEIQRRADLVSEAKSDVIAQAVANTADVETLNAAAQRLEQATLRRSLMWLGFSAIGTFIIIAMWRASQEEAERARKRS